VLRRKRLLNPLPSPANQFPVPDPRAKNPFPALRADGQFACQSAGAPLISDST